MQVLVKAKRAQLCAAPAGDLFTQLLDQFAFYMHFPIDAASGDPLAVRHCTSRETFLSVKVLNTAV